MKKIILTIAAMFALLQQSRAQTEKDTLQLSGSDTGFQSRKLKIEEINLVSSYYSQDGNNAVVTGGVGSEQLTDIANVIDVKLIRYDQKLRRHAIDAELGVDMYTSASSDKIDLQANSSASHSDKRIYPSVNYSVENERTGFSYGGGISYSTEYDYKSLGLNAFVTKKTKDRSGEFTARFQVYLDKVKLIKPIELRVTDDAPQTARNTYAGSLSYSRIVNERLQVMLLLDIIQQQGYLSLPFHRVYFNDNSVHQETLPDSRLKIPVGLRANYFLGDRFVLRAYYRYYSDNWGVTSHTASIEVPVKITPFLSVSPFYRYYSQKATRYFAPYLEHAASDEYYTSNYDLSTFNSNFFGANVRYAPPRGVLGIKHFSMAELRYGHYAKNISLHSDIISLNLKWKQ